MPNFTKAFTLTAGSPLFSNTQFTVSGPVATPTNGRVNVNLTSQTGRKVFKRLYGIASSTASGNFNSTFALTAWRNQMRNLNIQFYRQHAEEGMERSFNGQGTSPNFGWLDPFVNNFNSVFPNAELQWTIGWLSGAWPNSGGNFNVTWDQGSLNNFTSQCVQLAQYLKSKNIRVDYWDLWNEPDIQGATGTGGTFTSPQVVQQTTAAVYPALAALDSNYKFGGSPTAGPRNSGYINAAVSAFPSLFYDAGHNYFGGGDQGLGNDINNSVNLANFLRDNANSREYSLNEWSLDFNGVSSGIHTIDLSLSCSIMATIAAPTGGLTMTGVWDAAQDGFGFGTSAPNFCPLAFFLSRAGVTMPGNIVTSNSSGNNLIVLATTGGVCVTNYNTSGGAIGGGIAIGGLQNTTLQKWQAQSGNDNGSSTSINASQLITENYPPLSITIYSP